MNSESRSQSVPLFPVLLVNFIGTLGFSIVLPFLVFVVIRFGGNAHEPDTGRAQAEAPSPW